MTTLSVVIFFVLLYQAPMNILIVILVSFISLSASALELEFVGPCSPEPILTLSVKQAFDDVGSMTVYYLEKEFIPYVGSTGGISSVFGTPTGLEAMEVISDSEMRSYGWCFNVNGVYPETLADETWLVPQIKKVQWVYGYAHYKGGKWISQCEPAYKIRPAFICKK